MVDYRNFEQFLDSRIKRRNLIIGAGALSGLAIANQFSPQRAIARSRFSNYPFTLGVASGEPYPTSVVIWTRLAPEPLNGGGMPPVNVPIRWEVATDPEMRRIVSRGTVLATPQLAHSVRVIVEGLQSDTWYWYRFLVGQDASPIGRTRTAPLANSYLSKFNFGLVSCQNYQQGFYTAYKYLAQEDLDLVVHVGDYIYEGGISNSGPRQHNSAEIVTLEDYRNRHALYKTDTNLQAAHAAFPWIVTWDDHEVENNYANYISEIDTEPDQDRAIFLQRRAVAYQAYYEHMPLRPFSRPVGPDMQLYRRLSFGNLATFHVLDTRQYRTDQPCGDGTKQRPCGEDPNGTITGKRQEDWLYNGLNNSQAKWNVLAQQVIVAQIDTKAGEGETYSMDKWDGYVASRDRLMSFLEQRKPSNPVVLTGDVHSNWAINLKADFNNPKSATVGSEFVCTSITSGGDGTDTTPAVEAYLPDNPHIKFFNSQRGYVRCALTPTSWKTDYLVLSNVTTPNGTLSKRASFVVEDGRPEIQQA
ncbi:alkaline phosphatase D family protein [Nostoc sp. 'Peltigera malacea cyanobiont' DB3992]|uniref:alkaline phosphatase D family protein n=1 Tax=Nostoc sp. 'Peltigera malacea cyanobiont' DB3992 TaxID=1206980 RepID=UPI000C04B9C4|nr:alkaline phosphatase [Nostoc sp. 'Peltigera malacea cyanobiont' DB3992]PHM07657.1 alkaline phosphatase [Nostoc sp. 'Peltigera malacea cyanobiont' DB3992]